MITTYGTKYTTCEEEFKKFDDNFIKEIKTT